jgi:hypothetical protein
MCNAKSPYKISTARANSSAMAMARRTQAAIFVFSHGYSNESCWYWQDYNFSATLFFKNRPLFLPAISIFAGYFFYFDMSKKSKITKSALCLLLRWADYAASSRLRVSEAKIRAASTAT